MAKNSVHYKYAYYDIDGKRHVKTFTAPTKTKAKNLAKAWERERNEHQRTTMTVSDAVERYIDIKEQVLSPSTIRSNKAIQRKHIDGKIGDIRICDLSAVDVQRWVSDLSRCKKSPKTVRNCYGLLTASIRMQDDSFHPKISLPQPKPFENYCPSTTEVKTLIEEIRRSGDKSLLIGVMLSACGPLRQGEACALTSDDVKGNVVTINKSMVYTAQNTWEIKEPKNPQSNRKIIYPDIVIKELEGINGSLVGLNPNELYLRFRKACKRAGIPPFRFHDLRHYGISIMHAIGVPDVYILHRSGHKTDHVMKRVYRDVISEEEQKQTENILSYFSNNL